MIRRLLHAALGAGCLAMVVAGCSPMSRADRHPIDGLRMIGNDEPPAAEATDEQRQLRRVDLRVVGND